MTNRPLWRVNRNAVTRAGIVIAAITHHEQDRFGWRGLGLERVGFMSLDEVVADVKYFYRYRQPALRLHFKSGRVVEI